MPQTYMKRTPGPSGPTSDSQSWTSSGETARMGQSFLTAQGPSADAGRTLTPIGTSSAASASGPIQASKASDRALKKYTDQASCNRKQYDRAMERYNSSHETAYRPNGRDMRYLTNMLGDKKREQDELIEAFASNNDAVIGKYLARDIKGCRNFNPKGLFSTNAKDVRKDHGRYGIKANNMTLLSDVITPRMDHVVGEGEDMVSPEEYDAFSKDADDVAVAMTYADAAVCDDANGVITPAIK